jgi:hypothetical protein
VGGLVVLLMLPFVVAALDLAFRVAVAEAIRPVGHSDQVVTPPG